MTDSGSTHHPDLLAQLVSENWRERQSAIDALVKIEQSDLAWSILGIVRRGHMHLNVLSSALQVLEQVGRPITPEFINLLNGPDVELRIYIPLILGNLGGPEVIEALISTGANPTQPENVRFNAIEALGKLQAVEALPDLIELSQTDSPFIRFAAATALGQIGQPQAVDRLLALLEDPTVVEPAVTGLSQVGDSKTAGKIVSTLVRRINNLPIPLVVSALAALARRLDDHSSTVRNAFIQALHGPTGAGPAENQTIKALLSVSPGDPSGVQDNDPFWTDLTLLLSWVVADDDLDPSLTRAVQFCLIDLMAFPGALPLAEAALQKVPDDLVPALIKRLERGEIDTTRAVVRLLARTDNPDAQAVLLEVLNAEDDQIVTTAAEGLARSGDPLVETALLGLISHPAYSVRQAAVQSLIHLAGPGVARQASELLGSPDALTRASALELWVGVNPDSSFDQILIALRDPSPQVRCTAVEMLRFYQDARAVEAVHEAIGDPDVEIRRAAVMTCKSLPAEVALPMLYQAVRDPHHWVRLAAVTSIDHYLSPESVPFLLINMHDAYPPVSVAVIQAITHLAGKLPEADRSMLKNRVMAMTVDSDDEVKRAALSALDRWI